jgi:hypothetical protein
LGYKGKGKCVGYYQRDTAKNKKGDPKFEFVYAPGGVRDVMDVAIQLNYYRILMEKHGFKPKHMKVQMLIRGGLDKTAKSYGLDRMSYIIDINKISDIWVERYIKLKYDALMIALETNILPPVCSAKERWSSRSRPDFKCHNYCEVNEHCPYYQQNYGTVVSVNMTK